MGTEPLSSSAFRQALAQFASGVTVVTARGASGPVGFTATGFTSVSLVPPLVLVCVAARASAHDAVVGSDCFGVSILAEKQAWIAEQFARSGVDRFREVMLRDGSAPLIEGAVATLECRRYSRHEAGDHTILIGEVLETFVGSGRPLLHCARRYGAFVADPAARPGPSDAAFPRGERP